MNKLFVVTLLVALLIVAGCAKQAVQAQPSTESEVSSFENELADVDSLDDDLDTSELDSLDQDFAAMQ
jgi:hypothetical protein